MAVPATKVVVDVGGQTPPSSGVNSCIHGVRCCTFRTPRHPVAREAQGETGFVLRRGAVTRIKEHPWGFFFWAINRIWTPRSGPNFFKGMVEGGNSGASHRFVLRGLEVS